MSTNRTRIDWVKDYASRSDEALWDEYVANERDWQEDATHHSCANVLGEVLEHRGILPGTAKEVLWNAIEALFPNQSDLKGSILRYIALQDDHWQAAEEQIALGLTAAKNRGKRIGSGQFVHVRNARKSLSTESPWRRPAPLGLVTVDLDEHIKNAVAEMTKLLPAYLSATGLRADQVQIRTSLLTDGSQYVMNCWWAPR